MSNKHRQYIRTIENNWFVSSFHERSKYRLLKITQPRKTVLYYTIRILLCLMSSLSYAYTCIYKEYLTLQKGRVLDILVENRGRVNYGLMGTTILDEQLKGENYNDS